MTGNNAELGEIINDSEKSLKRIYQEAQRSEKVIELLNRALPSVYKQAATDGEEKYGRNDPDRGRFQLSPSGGEVESLRLDIVYLPSEPQRVAAELTMGPPEAIEETKVGEINLDNKSYQVYDSAGELLNEVPKEVISDTRLAMEELGFKETEEDELSE